MLWFNYKSSKKFSAFQPIHKMQSEAGPPTIYLKLVPKMLEPLVNIWVPNAYVVSFKLETDDELLIDKAHAALNKYKHKVCYIFMRNVKVLI